jgi:hypothetical protein
MTKHCHSMALQHERIEDQPHSMDLQRDSMTRHCHSMALHGDPMEDQPHSMDLQRHSMTTADS